MKLKEFYISISAILFALVVLVVIAKYPLANPADPESPVVVFETAQEKVSEIQTNKGQNSEKESLADSNKQEPEVEKPAELQNNQAPTQVIVPHTPHQVFTIIVEQPSQPVQQETPMSSSAQTYTIKKDGEVIKNSILEGELREFVASLNTYLTWKKKAKNASVEELKEMLSSNGYELES